MSGWPHRPSRECRSEADWVQGWSGVGINEVGAGSADREGRNVQQRQCRTREALRLDPELERSMFVHAVTRSDATTQTFERRAANVRVDNNVRLRGVCCKHTCMYVMLCYKTA